MSTDWRALCEELADTLERAQRALRFEGGCSDTTDNKRRALIARARAALAAGSDGPASVVSEPSDELVAQWIAEVWHEGTPVQVSASDLHLASKAAEWGARYGHQLAPPATQGEVAELVAALRQEADACFQLKSCGYVEWASRLTRAADLLEQRHPTPVPVAERLPGAEDCDGEGRCWLHLPDMGTEPLWRLTDPSMRSRYHSHWLPATALPLPAGEVK